VLAQDWRQILQDFGPLRKLFGDSWTNFVSLAQPPKAGAGPSTGASAGGSAAGAGTGTGTGEVATLIAFMSAEADKNREMQLKLMGLLVRFTGRRAVSRSGFHLEAARGDPFPSLVELSGHCERGARG
jgi:hypothetical protein